MIPSLGALESAADDVLRTVPSAITRGEMAAGLYGMGFLGRWALPQLRASGIRLTSCHDANPALQGRSAGGLPIQSANDLANARPHFLFVSARHAIRPVSEMLSKLSIPHVSYDAWHVASRLPDFRAIHHMLDDERSRTVLRAVLMAMLSGHAAHCEAVCEPDQYFCLPPFREGRDDIYIDAGAFDGDSVEGFIAAHDGAFAGIHAFEPGPEQFAQLQARAVRLSSEWALPRNSIETINAAVGETQGTARGSTANGGLTSFTVGDDDDGVPVPVVNLDGYLKGRPVTFLKADVEGMEMELLRGAQASIRRHRPRIAVCVYHYPADIPEITNYLASLVPGYRFALRHHSPQLMETVLYCWTE